MKRLGGLIIFFLLLFASARAQTNFSQWSKFQSPRFEFQMDYPEAWVVQETGIGQFRFYGEVTLLGEFFVDVIESNDSAGAENYFRDLKNNTRGASVDSSAGRNMLMYKIIKLNKGEETEVHNWVVTYHNRVYHCRYEFPAKLRDAANLRAEMQMAYQMIQSLTFTD